MTEIKLNAAQRLMQSFYPDTAAEGSVPLQPVLDLLRKDSKHKGGRRTASQHAQIAQGKAILAKIPDSKLEVILGPQLAFKIKAQRDKVRAIWQEILEGRRQTNIERGRDPLYPFVQNPATA